MDFNSLKAFISVAENQSFSAAAHQLHLTQPAISKRVANLEQQLGTKLLDRVGRKTILTPAGSALLPRARSLLVELEDTQRVLQNLSGEVSGTLNLGISHHLGLHRLPDILRKFCQQNPDVSLDIHFLDSEVAYERVLQGEIELGIITLTEHLSNHIETRIVWDDPLSLAVAPGHPLSKISLENDIHVLADFPALLPDENTFTGTLIKDFFDQQQIQLHQTSATNYLETLKMMVSIGLGWSLLPDTLIDDQLVRLKTPQIQLSRQLGAIHHTERTLSNAANALLALLPRYQASDQ